MTATAVTAQRDAAITTFATGGLTLITATRTPSGRLLPAVAMFTAAAWVAVLSTVRILPPLVTPSRLAVSLKPQAPQAFQSQAAEVALEGILRIIKFLKV